MKLPIDTLTGRAAVDFRAWPMSSRASPSAGAILHVRRVTQASHTQVLALGLTHHWRWTGTKPNGAYEAFACRSCGIVELHVIDMEGVEIDGDNVVAIDPEPAVPSAPFR